MDQSSEIADKTFNEDMEDASTLIDRMLFEMYYDKNWIKFFGGVKKNDLNEDENG